MKTIYIKLILLTAFLAVIQLTNAQKRVVQIQGITPGQPLVYDQIFNAIIADAPNRATNKNVVYELKRGQVYLATSTINSIDFDLHIRAEAGTGTLPVVFHTLNSAGGTAAMITARKNLTLENIEFDGRHSDGTLANRFMMMYGLNGRAIIRGCRIINDRGANFSIMVDGVKLYMTDCILGNSGHHISLGGNGRALDIRSTNTVDTVVFQNNTIYNLSDRIIRNMSPVINYLKFDHNTVVNVQGYNGCLQLGKTKKAVITNNIFSNPLTLGDRLTKRWKTEQLQPDKGFCVITHDSLSAKLPSAIVEMRNNNIYHDQKFVDFFNLTPAKDSIADPRPINNAIKKFVGDGLTQAYFREELVFKNTSDWKMLYDFTTYWVTHPKASVYPNNFSVIYPYEWDVTYSTASKSYKSGDNGYPLGDLNAWPTLKSQLLQGANLNKSAVIPSDEIEGLKIRQNYPNPFTDFTTIYYSLSQPQKMEISIYNSVGQKIKTLVNAEQKVGDYNIRWNGTNDQGAVLSKGLYVVSVSGANGRIVKKIMKN